MGKQRPLVVGTGVPQNLSIPPAVKYLLNPGCRVQVLWCSQLHRHAQGRPGSLSVLICVTPGKLTSLGIGVVARSK